MLFSIAIPAYKGQFLEECIDSILNQTFDDFELIIVNDCSPHAIDEIVGRFDDVRIKYLKNEKNIGAENLVNNWNACLEKASGEYFIMMGDDDKMKPDYLEEFFKLFLKYPLLDVYHCRSKIIDEQSVPFSLTPSWPEFESVYDNIYHRIMGFRLQYISDFVYRTQTLKANGGYFYLPLAWAADDISAYIACGKKGIAHTNKPVFNYRSSRFSISTLGNEELKLKAICMERDWFDQFLMDEPVDANDKIVWLELKKIVNKRLQKKKIFTITPTFNGHVFKMIFYWNKRRKTYHFSLSELGYSLLQHYINKLSKTKY